MYEIPVELKILYKHWGKHTNFRLKSNYKFHNKHLESELNYFAEERIKIWIKKDILKLEQPCSNDKSFQIFELCNTLFILFNNANYSEK